MDAVERTDGQLLAEFADRGSQVSFDLLVRRHGAMVAGVCRRLIGCGCDAEDAAQAVFIELAARARELRDRRSVAGWLHRTAWHISLRARRAAAARQRHERPDHTAGGRGLDDADAAQAHLLNAEAQRELDRALGLLADEYREALVLHHFEGMTVAQVAELLGCPPGTVAARLSRGRSLLRERLRWRGLVLVAGTHALSATFAEAVEAAEAVVPVGVRGLGDATWGAGGCGAEPVVRPGAAAVPAAAVPAPTALGPPLPAGGYGAAGYAAVSGGTAAAPAAASPVGVVAGFLPSAWLGVVGGRVTLTIALGFATSASAAVGTAGYRAWVESRPTASAVSAWGSGGSAWSGGWRWFDFGVESTAVPIRASPPEVRASREVEPPPTRSRPFDWGGGGRAGPAGVVPEPSALGLIAVGAAALLRRRRQPNRVPRRESGESPAR